MDFTMTAHKEKTSLLHNPPVNIRMKLTGLWIAAMFCYIYADIIGFYDPYLVGEILKGNMGFIGPITQGLKLGVALLMSIPAIMVIACCFTKPSICRWLNIIFGVVFTLVTITTISISTYYYYIYFGLLELSINIFIVWFSWKWPSEIAAQE